ARRARARRSLATGFEVADCKEAEGDAPSGALAPPSRFGARPCALLKRSGKKDRTRASDPRKESRRSFPVAPPIATGAAPAQHDQPMTRRILLVEDDAKLGTQIVEHLAGA